MNVGNTIAIISSSDLTGKALADKLREQQRDIDKMAYALSLLITNRAASDVLADAERIKAWIDDAITICEAQDQK